jgi:hypothetical protein
LIFILGKLCRLMMWSFQLWKMNYDYFVNYLCNQKIMTTPWFGGRNM